MYAVLNYYNSNKLFICTDVKLNKIKHSKMCLKYALNFFHMFFFVSLLVRLIILILIMHKYIYIHICIDVSIAKQNKYSNAYTCKNVIFTDFMYISRRLNFLFYIFTFIKKKHKTQVEKKLYYAY